MSARRVVFAFRPLTVDDLGNVIAYRVIFDCGHRKDVPANDPKMIRAVADRFTLMECKRCPPEIVIESSEMTTSGEETSKSP